MTEAWQSTLRFEPWNLSLSPLTSCWMRGEGGGARQLRSSGSFVILNMLFRWTSLYVHITVCKPFQISFVIHLIVLFYSISDFWLIISQTSGLLYLKHLSYSISDFCRIPSQTSALKEALEDLEWPNAAVAISFVSNPPMVSFRAEGHGELQVLWSVSIHFLRLWSLKWVTCWAKHYHFVPISRHLIRNCCHFCVFCR